jgi:NitT/TauT family transport system ATP-binding protein
MRGKHDAQPVVNGGERRRRPADATVEVRDASMRFDTRSGEVLALDDISFSAAENEFVSIVGPSGCGKSTTLRLIAGLCAPSSGEVLVNGEKVTGPPRGLWMMFQSAVLLDWLDVLNNVCLPLRTAGVAKNEAQERGMALLRATGLERFSKAFPYQLSGGMQQRVALCRSLVGNPAILLMDEPFAALDTITRNQLVMELQRLWLRDRMTVVFVTHNITEAVALSDKVIVMSPHPGRITRQLKLDLARPRTRDVQASAEFQDYVSDITDEIESQLKEEIL